MGQALRQASSEESKSEGGNPPANLRLLEKPTQSTFHTWAQARLEHLRSWVEKRYSSEIAQVEQEGKDRAARNELALFAHPAIRFGVFVCTLIVFITILQFTAPPRGIKKALVGQDVIYVPDVELCFGVGCLDNSKKIHSVKLPFFDLAKFSDYQDHDLFYRFRLNVTDEMWRRGIDTLYVLPVWGDADAYVTKNKIASGPMIFPIVPVDQKHGEVIIHVRTPAGSKFGIRGTTPPFLCNKKLARSLESEVHGQPFQIKYSFVAQIAGLGLLLVMFLTFPYRPELFTFLLLFGIETLRAELHFVLDEGRVLISPGIDKIFYNFLRVFGSLALIFFISTFFRRPVKATAEYLRAHIWTVLAAMVAGYIGLTSAFAELSGENALLITLWGIALLLATALSKNTFLLLLKQSAYYRLLLGSTALAGVGYWAWLNIRDHFVLTTAITTEYSNHLHFFFFMAVVLGIEIGRTEVKIKEAFALLPKEVVRLIHDGKESWREGFIILVDVVGWTSKLKALNEAETPKYMKNVNEYLLSFFDELGASVVSGTGDGFYITFEGAPTGDKFRRIAESCAQLAKNRPTFKEIGISNESIKNDPIIVRSAMGYGRYYIGFVQSNYLKKEYLAGFLGTRLARVIGDEVDPIGPRVLTGSELDLLRDSRPIFVQETKGEKTLYWLFS